MSMCMSCGGQKNKNSGEAAAEEPVKIYMPPPMPQMMNDRDSQARWAVEHYWDNFDFADTTAVANWSIYTEQAFVDFDSQLLMQVPPETGSEAIAVLFARAAANRPVFDRFAEIAEKYLFDANSPYRNEDLYIASLNAILANPALDQWERIRPQEQLRLALKNRPGDHAADFRYTLANGNTGTLHGLKARYTLLFFNNPGCPACREYIDKISASQFLSRLIDEGTLRVLAVYTDADIDAWREYNTSMPPQWILSYDAGEVIKNNDTYDLKAIPTLYLLDRDKRVMLKDEMSIPRIEQTLYDNGRNAAGGF
jgi:peroxiredoxin